MTITREQVEELADLLIWGFPEHQRNQRAAVMLRDLWQRVEQSEARIVELEAARPEILR